MLMMTRLLAAGLAAGCLVSALPASAQGTGGTTGAEAPALDNAEALELVTRVIDDAIRPGYRAFAEAARDAALRMDTLCAEPSERALETARDGFGGLVSAFAAIEFVRFGPIRTDNRLERILFFPDPRGVTRRQVEQLLAGADAGTLDADTLAQKSVAVQGLPALEFVLFGEGSDALAGTGGADRCSYGEAISQNLAAIASDLDTAWADETGIDRRLTHPGPDDPAYRTPADSIGEIVSIFTEGLEIIRDQRIGPALGADDEPAKPYLFLFNRSDNALAALKADFDGLGAMFETAEFSRVLPAQQAYLTGAIGLEFDQIGATLEALPSPLGAAAGNGDWRDKLAYAAIAAGSIRAQFESQLAPALGLASGFSSLDGD
ncbi:imelysin family protein [Fulvimarina sp. 2208YS6-2-32]|uniref:Imelysin family protein n=1 Tax=Fulvimarina uroteuthidis TaxID=3098149 RepID=A0ABU5I0Q6_9HYPH|nr:imelysin family protein [Fulvimarina sp. 2208YS6-2-32]MDY8108974.1 imelysin family protein [Fulvimarina sp. 2208YS6-2-32]